MSREAEIQLRARMQGYWCSFYSKKLMKKCRFDGDTLAGNFAKLAAKLAETFLTSFVESDNSFNGIRLGVPDFEPKSSVDAEIYAAWRDTYTTEVHSVFVRLPEGPMSASMFVVAVAVSFEQLKEHYRSKLKKVDFETECNTFFVLFPLFDAALISLPLNFHSLRLYFR